MTAILKSDLVRETRMSRKLMDVFIRAGLVVALTLLCYRIFAPFITMMAWALILAVTIYPGHQALARRLGGKQGLAATLLVLGGIALIVVPMAVVLGSMGDSVHETISRVKDNEFAVPAPPARVADVPIVGAKLHSFWSLAHTDMPAVVQRMQPELGELAAKALGMVASIGGTILLFMASFIIAGIIMAFGESVPKPRSPSSGALSAAGGARSSPRWPPRPFARWRWVWSAWPSSRRWRWASS